MRVIIVNSELKDYEGHGFHNTVSICYELKKRDIKFIVVGNKVATPLLLTDFVPYFPKWVYTALGGSGVIKFWSFFWRSFQLILLLKRLFKEKLALEDSDVVLVHSPREFELLAWALFLYKYRQLFEKKSVRVIVLSLTDYHRPWSIDYTLFLREIFRIAFWLLSQLHFVKVGTVSELIKHAYEGLTCIKVTLFPDLAVGINQIPPAIKEDKYVDVVYLGGARYTKGFDLLVEMIESFSPALPEMLRFWIQSNLQPGLNSHIVEKALRRLEEISSIHKTINLLRGPLCSFEYYGILSKSDIVVLPYRKEFYQRLASGPFVEALWFEKVPIIPDGTWMAYEAEKYCLKGLSFESGSVASLKETILTVSKNIKFFKQEMQRVSEEWRRYHNAENFINILFKENYKRQNHA